MLHILAGIDAARHNDGNFRLMRRRSLVDLRDDRLHLVVVMQPLDIRKLLLVETQMTARQRSLDHHRIGQPVILFPPVFNNHLRGFHAGHDGRKLRLRRTNAAAHETEIPVVMAGGVYTREDMEHYLEMGASGVQMATRFVTTYECDADPAYKQSYIDAKKEDIVIVQSPVGMPGRAILNPFMKRAKEGQIPHGKCHLCISTCKGADTPYCITDALVNAVKGKVDDALLFCGANAYRATHLEHVSEIMSEMSGEV